MKESNEIEKSARDNQDVLNPLILEERIDSLVRKVKKLVKGNGYSKALKKKAKELL